MSRWVSWLKPAVCFDDLDVIIMNVNQKGNVTELQVMTFAILNGYPVSIPYGDCDKYDQIWDVNGKLLKIQVKTARFKDEREIGIIFNCFSVSNGKKHKYTKNDIDFFATYWEGKCYLVPVEECSTEKTLWFERGGNNYSKCSFAKDYEAAEVLKNI